MAVTLRLSQSRLNGGSNARRQTLGLHAEEGRAATVQFPYRRIRSAHGGRQFQQTITRRREEERPRGQTPTARDNVTQETTDEQQPSTTGAETMESLQILAVSIGTG